MKSFEYAAPKTLRAATALLGNAWGETEIYAGGTDLVTCLKQRLVQPTRVVSLRNIKELRGIDSERGGLRIGAMTTLGQLASNKDVKKHFPSLVTAVEGIGSPQLLAVGTVGGDLCQRPRCWYYRNGFGLLAQHDGASLARDGENRYHAIFGNDGPALFVCPSSLGPALIALGATMMLANNDGSRSVEARDFFRTPAAETERETALRPGEILRDIFVPFKGLRNATYEIRHRHGLDWPYVAASVAMDLSGANAADTRVVLGHVAPTPWPAPAAGRAVDGMTVNEAVATRSGESAVEGAKPLSGNAYKIQMIKTAVKRAVLAAATA